MKHLLFLLVFVSTVCNAQAVRQREPFQAPIIQTFYDLERFPTDCTRKDENLEILIRTLRTYQFDPDPDKLNEEDRAFNSRLKATIWWYRYKCQK